VATRFHWIPHDGLTAAIEGQTREGVFAFAWGKNPGMNGQCKTLVQRLPYRPGAHHRPGVTEVLLPSGLLEMLEPPASLG
jgi:hypothetical protein